MDTSGPEGSVALAMRRDGPPAGEEGRQEAAGGSGREGEEPRRAGLEVLARTSLSREEEHAALLIPRIGELLEEVGAGREELEGIVVGSGPGSFTGVRVAAATAKAMARALGLPLWAFSSLAGAAAGEGSEGSAFPGGSPPRGSLLPRCVLFDARGDRVYAAAYRVAHGSLETLLAPLASTVFEVLEGLIPPGSVLLGDGAVRHRDLLAGEGHTVLEPPAGRPSAAGLLRLLELLPHARSLEDPGRWEPEYLRASGAEQMWTARKGVDR